MVSDSRIASSDLYEMMFFWKHWNGRDMTGSRVCEMLLFECGYFVACIHLCYLVIFLILSMIPCHYSDVIMSTITSQIISLTIVYSTVYSDADQRKHKSSASLAFVRGIHLGPVNSPHKRPVQRKMDPFGDVIMVQYFLTKNNPSYNRFMTDVVCFCTTELLLSCYPTVMRIVNSLCSSNSVGLWLWCCCRWWIVFDFFCSCRCFTTDWCQVDLMIPSETTPNLFVKQFAHKWNSLLPVPALHETYSRATSIQK